MTDKQFFDILDEVIKHTDIKTFLNDDEKLLENFEKKYTSFKDANTSKAKEITEKGIKIISFMKENEDTYNNAFTAAVIGDGLGINSKSIGGAMRKLVTDGFCSKTKGNPTCYHIEDKGRVFENQ